MPFFKLNKLLFFLLYFVLLVCFFRSNLIDFKNYLNKPNLQSYPVVLKESLGKLDYCPHGQSDSVRLNRTIFRNIKPGDCVSFAIPAGNDIKITIVEYSTRIPPITTFIVLAAIGFIFVIPHKKIFAPLITLLILGFTLRWTLLPNVIPSGTEPDAHSYLSLAQTITGPLGTQSREPLFVLWLKPFISVGNNPEFLNRVATICISLLVISAAYSVIYKKFGLLPATAVGLFIATHPLSQNLSVRGMRDELVSLLTIILINYLLFTFRKTLARFLFIGLLIGLLAVTRLETLSFSTILLFIVVLGKKLKPSQIIAIVIPVMIIITPYLYHNKKLYNDPFYPSTLHATWFRNYEFLLVKKTGCDGCPSLADYPRDSSGGTRITSFEYLFSYHSIPELFSTSVSGLMNLLLLRHNAIVFLGYENYFIHGAYLAGLLYLLIKRKWLYLFLPLILINALIYFLGVDGFLDVRILINILPFIGLIIYFGIVAVWHTLRLAFWDYWH